MLGNEQDCYGGCTDSTQAFYGLMDEVSHIPSLSSHKQKPHFAALGSFSAAYAVLLHLYDASRPKSRWFLEQLVIQAAFLLLLQSCRASIMPPHQTGGGFWSN